MPIYAYRTIDPKGKKHAGVIEALSETIARQELRTQGLMVTHLGLQPRQTTRQSLRGQNLLAFTVQLGQLLLAGVPLYESLVTMEEQYRNEPYHRVLHSLTERVRSGTALSEAMRDFPESFDRLYRSLIAAGEAVGDLGGSLEKLADLLTKQRKVQRQITNALIYPAILSTFALVVICVLLGFVVPSIEGIFADRQVGGLTRAIIAISHGFRSYGWMALPSSALGIFFLRRKLRSSEGVLWQQQFFLRLPLLRTLTIQAAVTRFARTLSTLQQGGLPLIPSLRIAREVMQNVVIQKEMERAEQEIIAGKSLSSQLLLSKVIPPMVARMVAVGEESGNTMAILQKIADIYEEEMEKSIEKLLALLQPIILLVMGTLIGIVLVAILLPLTDVGSFTL